MLKRFLEYIEEKIKDHSHEAYLDRLSMYGWDGDEKFYNKKKKINEAQAPSDPIANEKKRIDTVKPRLKKMFDTYGDATPKAPSEPELKKKISSRFDELGAMKPEDREKEYHEANKRAKSVGISQPLDSGNAKTDTAQDLPGPHAPKGHITLGMSMTPDVARHYTKPDASEHHSWDACAGSTHSCREACLAKHGNYEFATNKGHMDIKTQSMTHNDLATKDHSTRVFQTLEKAHSKAKKEGKAVLTRFSITNDTGSNVHSDAVSKHFPHVVQMGYTKKLNTPHDPSKNIHSIYSDPGPMVIHHSDDGPKLNQENIHRRTVLRKATINKGMPTYMVFNKNRPRKTEGPGAKKYDNYHNTLKTLHTVRRYEEHPTTLGSGEKAEYHSPEGHGRITYEGKSFKYQDHPVSDPIKDVHSKSLYPSEHDARNLDTSSRTFKSSEGKKVGHVVVAFATASTSKKHLTNTGFFHRTENIHNGIYHDGHPAEMAAAGHVSVEKNATAAQPKHNPFAHIGQK